MGLKETIQAALTASKPRRKRERLAEALVAALLGRDPVQGEELFVGEMSAFESDDYEAKRVTIRNIDGKQVNELNRTNFRARLVVKCLVDAAGNPLFEDGDADALGRGLDSATMGVVWEQAARLNGLLKEEEPLKNDPPAVAPSA